MSSIGDSLLDWQSVCNAVGGISRSTLWRWVASGQFPKPDIAQGRKYRRWKWSSVQKWKDKAR